MVSHTVYIPHKQTWNKTNFKQCQSCKWIKWKIIYLNCRKDMKTWLIIAVMHITYAIVKLKTEQNSGLNFFSGFDFITAWVVFITAKISVISSHPLVLLDKNLEGSVLTSIWQTAYASWIKENWTSRYLLISVLVGGIWTESCSSISFVKKK